MHGRSRISIGGSFTATTAASSEDGSSSSSSSSTSIKYQYHLGYLSMFLIVAALLHVCAFSSSLAVASNLSRCSFYYCTANHTPHQLHLTIILINVSYPAAELSERLPPSSFR